MELDEAVLKLLRLQPELTTVSRGGGGGCSSASTSKISSRDAEGNPVYFFMKTGSGEAFEVMFRGEHDSLRAIHDAVPNLCPRPLGWGAFASAPSTYFLVTEFLDLSTRSSAPSKPAQGTDGARSLAEKLARLHKSPAPTPPGFSKPMFGFPVTTCCGDTPQENGFRESWAHFYAENRLGFILRRCELANGKDAELRRLVEDTASKVVPRLVGDTHLNNGRGVRPVVVHGDLWSGNASKGRIGSCSTVQDVVFDPSTCFAHSEYELGIMRMFGGFGAAFMEEYHRLCPKTEPAGEYEDRVALYELYHHLNHHAMFGGGYRSGAVSIMKKLIRKYGDEGL